MLSKPLRNLALFKQNVFRHAAMLAVPSAVAAGTIKIFDTMNSFLHVVPEKEVFTSFSATVSLLLVFRAVRALSIYHEGARGVHQMAGSWYDSASTLIAFCRSSTAPNEVVANFKNTLVRLFSLLNMLCLVELENAKDENQSHAVRLNTIDIEGLDNETLGHVKNSVGKAEVVCQSIQCLIVDSIGTGVLSLPAPILSRSFQDLGNGMLKFHETVHLSRSPVPITLLLVTELLLLLNAIFSPFMMAVWTKGPGTAAVFTFVINLIFFSLNSLAKEIENPFGGDFNDIDVRTLHHDLNVRLMELLELSTASAARTSTARRSFNEIRFETSCSVDYVASKSEMSAWRTDKASMKRSKRFAKVDDMLANVLCGGDTVVQLSSSAGFAPGGMGRQSSMHGYQSTESTAPSFESKTSSLPTNSRWSDKSSTEKSSMQLVHEGEAFDPREEAFAALNEASRWSAPRVAGGTDIPTTLGHAPDTPRGCDANNMHVLQVPSQRCHVWV